MLHSTPLQCFFRKQRADSVGLGLRLLSSKTPKHCFLSFYISVDPHHHLFSSLLVFFFLGLSASPLLLCWLSVFGGYAFVFLLTSVLFIRFLIKKFFGRFVSDTGKFPQSAPDRCVRACVQSSSTKHSVVLSPHTPAHWSDIKHWLRAACADF